MPRRVSVGLLNMFGFLWRFLSVFKLCVQVVGLDVLNNPGFSVVFLPVLLGGFGLIGHV